MGRYRVLGVIPVRALLNGSIRVGEQVSSARLNVDRRAVFAEDAQLQRGRGGRHYFFRVYRV